MRSRSGAFRPKTSARSRERCAAASRGCLPTDPVNQGSENTGLEPPSHSLLGLNGCFAPDFGR